METPFPTISPACQCAHVVLKTQELRGFRWKVWGHLSQHPEHCLTGRKLRAVPWHLSEPLFADARTIATPSPLNSSNAEPCRALLVLAWLPHRLAHSSVPWAPVTDSKAGPMALFLPTSQLCCKIITLLLPPTC